MENAVPGTKRKRRTTETTSFLNFHLTNSNQDLTTTPSPFEIDLGQDLLPQVEPPRIFPSLQFDRIRLVFMRHGREPGTTFVDVTGVENPLAGAIKCQDRHQHRMGIGFKSLADSVFERLHFLHRFRTSR
jgi:hypothetical protein